MAQLVALGGAALGSFSGVGGGVGWIVGSIIGNLLFPPDGVVNRGPRLGDLTITSSTYGSVIPKGYGTIRRAGNVIWSSGIEEIELRRKQGGKGGILGGSSVTQISYTYQASFAVSFGVGPNADLLRLWADGKLIYDKRGLTNNPAKAGLIFRFYPGDEAQLPDSLIEADKGEDQVPAFRGQTYVVFEELPLADYGNRLPNLTAEISEAVTDVKTAVPATEISGGTLATFDTDAFAVDFERGYGYAFDTSGTTATTGIRRINLHTMAEDRQVTSADALDQATSTKVNQVAVIDGSGALIVTSNTFLNNAEPILRIDPVTLHETSRFGAGSAATTMGPTTWAVAKSYAPLSLIGPLGQENYVVSITLSDSYGILRTDEPISYVWDSDTFLNGISSARVLGCCRGAVAEGFGDAYVAHGPNYGGGASAGDVVIVRVRIEAGAGYAAVAGQDVSHGVTATDVATLAPGDIVSGASTLNQACEGMVYDATDDTVIIHVLAGSQDYLAKIDPADGSVVWSSAVSEGPDDGTSWGASRIQNDTFGYVRAGKGYLIDTRTGEVLVDGETWTGATDASGSLGSYDSRTDSFVGLATTHVMARWYFRRVTGLDANLDEVVEDVCVLSGMETTDVDVTDLSSTTFTGYLLGSQTSGRKAIEPLSGAFFFDGYESDYTLKFRLRGDATVASLTIDDLVRNGDREAQTQRRAQETELPERFTVVYMDSENDYQQGTQHSKRVGSPTAAMFSTNQLGLTVPAAFTSEFAKQLAETSLFISWNERDSYEQELSWAHLALDPTDPIQYTRPDGETYRLRLSAVELGADYTIATTGILETQEQYTSVVLADRGDGPPTHEIPGEVPTKLLLLDSPLLRDQDAVARAFAQVYYFMGGYGQDGWRGATLYKSSDGATYDEVGRIVSEMTWGATVDALGDPPDNNPFATDETNTLTIALSTDADVLSSVTETQMLNGANAAMLIKLDGTLEIIQFQNVTDNGDGTFTLDTLLRGRRGTDTMSYDHTVGEIFLFLDENDGNKFGVALTELNATRYYRGVHNGQLLEQAELTAKSIIGRALMPYAPVQVAAADAGGGDVDFTWERRTRVGGAFQDEFGNVPLSEDSEEYEIDILDGPGGSVVRTFTGITSKTKTYTAAQQSTDSTSSPFTLVVYQISAQVGRGFGQEVTVDVV